MSKARIKLEKGLEHLVDGKFKLSLKYFQASVQESTTNLECAVAAWWVVNVSKYRKEWKKKKYGNANLFYYEDKNSGKAWSDVEIAAILLTPNNKKINSYLGKFLGRSFESVRFQRRYARGRTLGSWLKESGERYTRYTQTVNVKNRLGV